MGFGLLLEFCENFLVFCFEPAKSLLILGFQLYLVLFCFSLLVFCCYSFIMSKLAIDVCLLGLNLLGLFFGRGPKLLVYTHFSGRNYKPCVWSLYTCTRRYYFEHLVFTELNIPSAQSFPLRRLLVLVISNVSARNVPGYINIADIELSRDSCNRKGIVQSKIITRYPKTPSIRDSITQDGESAPL